MDYKRELERLCHLVCSATKHTCNAFSSTCAKCSAADLLAKMGTEELTEELTADELRGRYKTLRIDLGFTYREVTTMLNLPSTFLTRLEVGEIDPLEVDYSTTINAICHNCHERIKVHPVKNVVFPSYICKGCREKA